MRIVDASRLVLGTTNDVRELKSSVVSLPPNSGVFAVTASIAATRTRGSTSKTPVHPCVGTSLTSAGAVFTRVVTSRTEIGK